VTGGGSVLRGRLRGLHRTPTCADCASPGHTHHQSARATLRRGAPANEGDPARLWRAGGDEADVRGDHASESDLAWCRRERVRKKAACHAQRRAQSEIRAAARSETETRVPLTKLQQPWDLT